jgi:hypothetical protein
LGNEAVRMKDWTFEKILATPPPEDFQLLWDGDLARWMEQNPKAVKKVRGEAA